MDALIQDLRYAVRTLLKSPGFTLVAVLTLALGIGANTAIFSVLYAVLIRPLPFPEPDRLVGLSQTYRGSREEKPVEWRQYRFLDENSRVFEGLAVSTTLGFNVFTGQEADRVRGMRVSSDFFRVLGVSPLLGRAFAEDEDQPGGPNVAVLSYGYWQRRFGGDRSIVGRAVSLDGAPYTVVGVMPAGFQTQSEADVWSTVAQVSRTVGSGSNLVLIGRLKPGLSLARAQAEFAPTVAAFRDAFKGPNLPPELGIELYPQRQLIVTELKTPLQVLFGAIGFVLLIACANVAGLLLGRATGRGRELALRVALGASRARVIRQLLTESVVLSLIGGAVALVLARWGLQLLLTFVPPEIRAADIRLDWWAVLFTFAVSLAIGVVFGLLPAWQASRPDVHEALKEGSGRTTATAGHGRLRDVLAAGEVALSLVLLVGAGLLIRTVGNLLSTDPGFNPRHVLSAEIWLNGTGYDSSATIADFYRRLTAHVELLPGVRSAAVVEAGLPLERGGNQYVAIEGRAEGASVDYRTITPRYFEALGIRLERGRALTAGDVQGADPVAVVNETFERRYLSGDAINRTVSFEGGTRPPRRIVGVVGDVRSFIGSPARPTVFLPSAQTPLSYTRMFGSWFPIHVVAGTSGDPGALVAGLTRAIHETDPRVPVGRVRPLEEILSSSVAQSRFQMLLLAIFASLALVLAAVGIYGVTSYLVVQRSHEIGVRLALGAVPLDVLGMVLRRGMLLALAGAAAGLLGSVALTRLLKNWLYEVSPADLPTLGAVTALLLLVALAACWLPARRAARVDPVVALRSE